MCCQEAHSFTNHVFFPSNNQAKITVSKESSWHDAVFAGTSEWWPLSEQGWQWWFAGRWLSSWDSHPCWAGTTWGASSKTAPSAPTSLLPASLKTSLAWTTWSTSTFLAGCCRHCCSCWSSMQRSSTWSTSSLTIRRSPAVTQIPTSTMTRSLILLNR